MPTDYLLAGDNDNLLQLSGLKNGTDNAFVNNASVTVTLTDTKGVDVPGMNWPANLTYVSGSQGCYRLQLGNVLNLAAGKYYTLHVSAVADGMHATFKQTIQATERTL